MKVACKIFDLLAALGMDKLQERHAEHCSDCQTCRSRSQITDSLLRQRRVNATDDLAPVPASLLAAIREPASVNAPEEARVLRFAVLPLATAAIVAAVVLIFQPPETPRVTSKSKPKRVERQPTNFSMPAPTLAVSGLAVSAPYEKELDLLADDFRRVAGMRAKNGN